MKKKVTYLILLFTLMLSLSACTSSQTNSNRWQWVCSNSFHGYFFDNQSVVKDSSGITAWIKTVYTYEAVLDKVKKSGPKYKDLSYSLAKTTYTSNYSQTHEILYYDKQKKVIYSYTGDDIQRSIVPGSMGELIKNALYNFRQ